MRLVKKTSLNVWHVAAMLLLAIAATLSSVEAEAACHEEGGNEACSSPNLTDWQANGCWLGTDFSYVTGRWCEARGGTWTGEGATPPCPGGVPATDTNMDSIAANFITRMNPNNSSCSVASITGWGQSGSWGACGSGGPQTIAGILVGTTKVITPTAGCERTVVVTKNRSMSCDLDSTSRTEADGKQVCIKPRENLCCAENTGLPITFGTGTKLLTETDYQAAGGTLSFTRYYTSAYYFAPRSSGGERPRDMGFNWRHNFLKRIYPITGSTYVAAATTFPNGDFQYYDHSGNEVIDGGRGRTKLITTAQGFQLKKSDDSIENYDTSGRLTSIQFQSGVVQSLTYTDGTDGSQSGNGGFYVTAAGTQGTIVMPAGLLLRVTDSFGRTLTFGYEELEGRLSKVTVPGGASIRYAYDANANLTQVTQTDNTQRTYHYNELAYIANTTLKNALTGITDENGVRYMTYYYDSRGRAYKEVSPSAGTNTDQHELSMNVPALTTTVTNALGAVQTYGFQKGNAGHLRLISKTRPASVGNGTVSSSVSYDANGNIASETDFNGITTNRVFDSARNLETSRTEAYGTAKARTTTTQWHSTYRKPLLITEPGRSTSFVYDVNGNLESRTATDTATSVSRTWTYTYNGFGQVLTLDGPRTDVSDVTTYTYYNCTTGVQCGQIATITDAVGNVTTYLTYNAHGMPLTISDPNGSVTTLTYDSRSRLASRAVGTEVSTFEYYPTGLLKKVTMPDLSFVQYTYDNAQRLTGVQDSEGNRIAYTLDAAGNRTAESVYDPANVLARTRSSVFDTLGRVSQEIGAANQTTTYSYDNGDRLASVTDPENRSSSYAYDALNRKESFTDSAGGITQYGYDTNGNLTSVTDPKQLTTTYAINALGEQTQLTSPDTGVSQFTLDSAGNISQSTDARGRAATYTRDALNRVTNIAYADQTIHYTYDQGATGKGRLTNAMDGSGSTTWTYDTQGRLLTKLQTVSAVSRNVAYSYNTVGQLSTLTTPANHVIGYSYSNGKLSGITLNGVTVLDQILYAPFGATRGWRWGNGTFAIREYNLDGNLLTLDSAGQVGYTFNDDGTIATRTDDAVISLGLPTGATAFGVSATSNRISNASGNLTRTYSYDNAGNTLNDGTRSFTYNDAGRMATSTNGGLTTTYSYNALGQRVRKSSSSGTNYFVYDEAGRLLGEYDQAGALIQELVWFGDIPVATIRTDQSGGSVGVFYIHTDHLNAPAKITRPADNQIIWRWDHDPFGNGVPNEDPDGNGLVLAFSLRFPGQYLDSETGLHYNYFRDGYDPAVGRYTQSDPIGLGGGINTYSYVGSSPISNYDAQGLIAAHDIPARPGDNTVVCDGMGGMILQINLPGGPHKRQCTGDCLIAHEYDHLKYNLRVNPKVCVGRKAHTYVEFSNPEEQKAGELHAYAVELQCLRSKLRSDSCGTCDEIIRVVIEEIQKHVKRKYKAEL